MDLIFSDDHISLKKAAIEFAQKCLNSRVKDRDSASEFNSEGWNKCADFGIQALPVPSDLGGLGLDLLSCVAVMEGLGYGCVDNGILFALNSHLWTCVVPIVKFGTNFQKKKYLPSLLNGKLKGCHAITEPNSGSDAFSMQCKADKIDGGYLINGTKTFISNAPIADVIIVFAVTNKEKGFAGISAFILDNKLNGFEKGKPFSTMGLRTCPIGEVSFTNCFIPEENRLGKEGSGVAIFNSEMEWERSCLFATHVGAMSRDLEECISYANTRYQFKKPIGKHQAIAHKIAEMFVRLELSKLVLYKLACLKTAGRRAPIESAVAKLVISENYVANCIEAIQIHGAYGYSTELDFERNLRDAIAGKIYSGTSEIQKNVIATLLGL